MEVSEAPAMDLDPSAPDAQAPQAAPALARPRSIKVNFMINVAGAIIPLGVSLVTVPIYIRHIGDARYGVLSIVWVLLGYFGFLDLGLSRAAANALARLRDAPQEVRARVLVTTLVLNFGMGLVGSLALALAGSYLLQHVLNVPDSLKPEIASAFPWIVALFPLALVSGVGIGTLESREEFLRVNMLQVVGTSLGQIVPVMLAVGIGPSLAVVIPAAALARGLTVVATLIMVWRQEGPLRAIHYDRRAIRGLLQYGGWISVSAVISPILTSLDQFVIGSIIGVAAIAHYVVPMSLVLRSQVFPIALNRTLFPRMSQGETNSALSLAKKSTVRLACCYCVIVCPGIFLLGPFMRAWLGEAYGGSPVLTGQILLLGAWINGIAHIPGGLIQARGRPDLTARSHILEVLPFVAILLVCTRLFGIEGSAAAWTLRVLVDTTLMFIFSGVGSKKLTIEIGKPAGLIFFSLAIQIQTQPGLVSSLALGGAAALASIMLVLSEPNMLATIRRRAPNHFLTLSVWAGTER